MVELDIKVEREDIEFCLGLIGDKRPTPATVELSNGKKLTYERFDGVLYAVLNKNMHPITCPNFEQGMNGDYRRCHGPTYNAGLSLNLCSSDQHHKCACYNRSIGLSDEQLFGIEAHKLESMPKRTQV